MWPVRLTLTWLTSSSSHAPTEWWVSCHALDYHLAVWGVCRVSAASTCHTALALSFSWKIQSAAAMSALCCLWSFHLISTSSYSNATILMAFFKTICVRRPPHSSGKLSPNAFPLFCQLKTTPLFASSAQPLIVALILCCGHCGGVVCQLVYGLGRNVPNETQREELNKYRIFA